MMHALKFLLLLGSFGLAITAFSQRRESDGKLFLITDTADRNAYKDRAGNVVIPFGKYPVIYTPFFKNHAIVVKPGEGMVAIDRQEKVLYKVFPFDNGPDYPSGGLYRILDNGKIGYANRKGKVVIPAQYDCAYPFENGKAKVSNACKTIAHGEHQTWESENWYYINRKGKKIAAR